MMRLHTVGCGPLERSVTVVVGLIYLVDEGWPLFGPDATDTMTCGTISDELLFPALKFSRYGGRCRALRLALSLAARRRSPKRKHQNTHPHRA